MALEEIGARLSLKDRQKFSAEARAARKSVDDVGKSTKTSGSHASLASKNFLSLSSAWRSLTSVGKFAITGITAVGGAVVFASAKLFGLASAAKETSDRFNTVFGSQAAQMTTWQQGLSQRFGLTTKSLEDASSAFGVFAQSAGLPAKAIPKFSQTLTQAGLDLASFYDQDPSQVFEAITSGLGGQVRPLRQYGIFLSDTAVQLKAKTMGMTGTLTDQQKVVVRQQLIMEQLGKANNDLSRTYSSAANQSRAFKGRLTELATRAGQALYGIGQGVLANLNHKLEPAMRTATALAPKVGAALSAGLFRTEWASSGTSAERWGHQVGSGLRTVAGLGAKAAATIPKLFSSFRTGLATRSSRAAGGGAETLFARLGSAARSLGIIWQTVLAPAFADVGRVLPAVLAPLAHFDETLRFIADHGRVIEPIVTGLFAAFAAYKVIRLATVAMAAFNLVMDANPISLIIIGLVALGAGLYAAYKHFPAFHRGIDRIWQAINHVYHVIQLVVPWVAKAVVFWFKWLTPFGLIVTHLHEIASLLSDIWQPLWGGFKAALNFIIRLWDNFIGNIPAVHISVLGKHLDVDLGKTLQIPQLAAGGVAMSPGWSVVGEGRYPEVVDRPQLRWLDAGARVTPLPALAGGGALAPVVNFHDGAIRISESRDGRETYRQVRQAVSDAIARR